MFVAKIKYPCNIAVVILSPLPHKMNYHGTAQGTNCAVCQAHTQIVAALRPMLSDWGMGGESREIPAPRHECDAYKQRQPDCPFEDGWMDEVAYGLLLCCAGEGDGLPPGVPADFTSLHQELFQQALDILKRERASLIAPPRNPRSAQWELGTETARVLRRFFEACVPEEHESVRKRVAFGQLVSLSFRIQESPTTPAGLRRIVNSCLLAGQCGVTFMRVPEKGELLRLLTQPILDVAKWVHRLESLWRTFPI
jgi:hypothetical protein